MDYDLIVIGAGPGGYEAAFEAADLGMKTALVEKEETGGTCLNRGCIPTKALLHAAELYRSMKEAEAAGVCAKEILYDPRKMQQRKREVVLQLRKGIEDTAKRKKVELIRGTGTVCGEGRVSVRTAAEERLLTADRILIATGSRPIRPPIEGISLPGVVTSDELLEYEEPVGSLVIIGGGVIGVEFAALYQALGTQVTVIEAMPQLLPNLDRELAQSLKMLMKKRGIAVCTGARVEAIRQRESGGLVCEYTADKPDTAEADAVLVCVGRRPYTEGLFAEGFRPDMDRGCIRVNERYETSLPGVYAIGDVTGGIMLAHAAAAEGRNAARIMAGRAEAADMRWIPSCIYTEPEIACVGMTADEAKAAGIDADSRKVPMGANGRTVIAGGERGYIRVVSERETGRILGAQMMCARATDLISEFTQALSAGLTVGDLARVIRPHPTFSEAISDAVRG
ncbi:MAG: dihydrolipoyl dehydrogenase [Clostridia bacterium]|nr:dihydrolipoyl dehydrogenase [Clostridia bacterium]